MKAKRSTRITFDKGIKSTVVKSIHNGAKYKDVTTQYDLTPSATEKRLK